MSVKVAKSRFILNFSLQNYGELYQHLLRGISSFQELGERLIGKAELAKAFRYTKMLEEIVSMLVTIPIREYQLIGEYYQGLNDYFKGGKPQEIFEKVLEKSYSYKAKALISLAALEAQKGNYESELQLFTQASKFTTSPSILAEVHRSIAVVKAKEGFHKQSLKELESMFAYIRYVEPYAYCQYLNSYAVELGEVGRIEEAQNVCRITLASPYAFAYPEWRETGAETARRGYKSRSSVRVIQSFSEPEKIQNVLQLPERTPALVSSVPKKPASVLNYLEWKKKMEKNGEDKIDPQKMSEREVLLKIIELSSGEDVTERELRQILDAIVKIRSKQS